MPPVLIVTVLLFTVAPLPLTVIVSPNEIEAVISFKFISESKVSVVLLSVFSVDSITVSLLSFVVVFEQATELIHKEIIVKAKISFFFIISSKYFITFC